MSGDGAQITGVGGARAPAASPLATGLNKSHYWIRHGRHLKA